MSKTNTRIEDDAQGRIGPDRKTVLVMEDEEEHGEVYARWLEDEYEVRRAYDGDEAIKLYDEDVDVALLGRSASGISGREVLEDIRELPGDCRAAVITSAEPVDEVSMEFEACLEKPVGEEDIRGVTENLLALADYHDAGGVPFEPDSEDASIHLDKLAGIANETDPEVEDLLRGLIDTVRAACDPALVSTWTFDGGNTLERREQVDAFEDDESAVPLDERKIEDILWQTYSNDETQQRFPIEDLIEGDAESLGHPVETCMAYRLGNHGVALVFLTEDSLNPSERAVLRSAATMVGSSLANKENRRRVEQQRRRSSEYERRNTDLEELNRLVKRTSRKLVASTTRNEIEQSLCRQLTRSRFIDFAWIGEYVESGDKLTVKHYTDERYMETLLDNGEKVAAKQVVEDGEPEITRSLKGSPPLDPWREKALRHGFTSVIRIPLRQDSSVEGVLTVYIGDPPGDFTDLKSALEDLSSVVGHAINSYEAKASLVLNKVTEIKSRVADKRFPHVRLASLADTSVVLEDIDSREEGGYRQFLSFEANDDRDTREVVSEAVDSIPAVESCNHVSSRKDREAFEVTGDLFLEEIVHRGGRPTSLVATPEAAELTIQTPKFVSTSSFVSLIEQEYDSVELLSKNNVDEGFDTFCEVEEMLHSELTETEIETIKTAYYGGYFASPREKTGQDLGNELGVTQPTVTENIKSAEEKILRLLFDDGILDVDDSGP